MNRKTELESIWQQGILARQELDKIDTAERNEINKRFIGQCQKFSNSYGSDERWWLYRKIGAVDGSWCTTFTFQTTATGRIEIETRDHDTLESSSWVDITNDEFEAAYLELLEYQRAKYEQASAGKSGSDSK